MDLFSAIVSDVKPSINDMLNVRGGQVTDLALSLINRARYRVWQYKPWSYFRSSTTLTLDSDLESDLPSDYGRVHRITESETTTWPVYSFDHTDKTKKYTFVNTASISTGITQKIKFHNSQTSLFMQYIMKIEKVTDDAHYLLFPVDLVIKAAMVEHALDEKQKAATVNYLDNALKEAMKDFSQFYHSANAQRTPTQRDYYGTEISNDTITMLGD